MTDTQKQCLLTFLGYDTGGIGNGWGEKSEKATRQFQNDFGGITVDGVCGEETQKALKHAVAYGMPEKDTVDTTEKPPGKAGTFWDEIEYFDREEFRCKCGGKYCNGFPHEPQEAMVRLADGARRHFGKPATVVSGLRCETHNANEGGVVNSQHIYGEACDLRIDGVSAATLLAWFQGQSGVRYTYAINSTNVHFDIPKGAR